MLFLRRYQRIIIYIATFSSINTQRRVINNVIKV